MICLNKVKKLLCVILTAAVLSTTAFAAGDFGAGNVVCAQTPKNAQSASLRWSKKLGNSYRDAPSSPLVVNDTMLVMSGKTIYKLRLSDGEILASATMEDTPSYSYTPPTYSDGVVYCPLDNAIIQAFDYETLTSMWIYRDSLGGQSLTEIVCSSGRLFTGFWNDEEEEANYVCLDTADPDPTRGDETKTAEWIYSHKGGFYWAKCIVKGQSVVFGGDDSTAYDNADSMLKSLDINTGRLIDTVNIKGDQRSGVVYCSETDSLMFVTKAGYFYSVKIKADGTFDKASLKSLNLGGASTSTPAVYNGRAYVGVQGSGFGEGSIQVIDCVNMKKIYSVKTRGYPQNSVLLSCGYENQGSKVYIYSCYNTSPGGICVFSDSPSQTSATAEDLFIPDEAYRNYSVDSIISGSDGTLYYKNDSGCIFAVENTKRQTPDCYQIIRIILAFVNKMCRIFGISG